MIEVAETEEYCFLDNSGRVRATPIVGHEARGRCSGIPPCCIEHYVSVTLSGRVSDVDPRAASWGYRPCPPCVERGNRVEIRHCADDNGARCTCGAWANSRLVSDDEQHDDGWTCQSCGEMYEFCECPVPNLDGGEA